MSKPLDAAHIRNHAKLLNLYFEIRRLTRNRLRYCFAGNENLAKRLACSVDSIARWKRRLEALGAITIERIIGCEDRVRIALSPEALKAKLFRGHSSNRRPEPFSAPIVAATPAATVAEGHKRISRRDTLQTLPTEEGQQAVSALSTDISKALRSAAASLLRKALPELKSADAATIAAIATREGKTIGQIEQAGLVVKARIEAGRSFTNLGGALVTAIRQGWQPAPAPPTHPSEVREPLYRPVAVAAPPKPTGELGHGYEAFATQMSRMKGAAGR